MDEFNSRCVLDITSLVRRGMDVKEHKRLSNITLGHTFKNRNNAFVPVLHFTITVGSATMSITHTIT
jgi:hypothetical protein